jgi:Bifunctional DNA primase/polymerase, N-terminal
MTAHAPARDALAIARDALARGVMPLPVPLGKKNPVIDKWQHLTITNENVETFFNGAGMNVGARMGAKSGGLADVDLDCAEALGLAPYFLPTTGSIYGRASKRQSHWNYTCDDPDDKAWVKLSDESNAVIVELRLGGGGKGAQSIWPGSIHADTGETYEWDRDGERSRRSCAELKAAVLRIAVGTILVRHWPMLGGRHDTALVVGGFLARAGWSADDIEHFVTAICTVHGEATDPAAHGGTARDAAEQHAEGGNVFGLPRMIEIFGESVMGKIAKLVGYRREAVEPPTSESGLPTIKVEGGKLSQQADAAEDALIKAGVQFFQRANKLVRPIVKQVDSFHGRRTTVAQLAQVEQAYMRDKLCRAANWYQLNRREKQWVAVDPPYDVANTVLARAGDWTFPRIAGIITTQTMRSDGTILDQPGYDPATRLLLVDPPPMPPIPENPTKDDAIAALAKLEALLEEFPLVDDVAKSVALSALITPVVRGAFSVTPMHVATAPVASSGKSYLFDTASYIALGQAMPVIAAGRNEEETEKRLGAAVLAAQPLICIDNVNGELGGDGLCQIIERTRPNIRILGRSENVEVEARCSMFANGNNITILSDLCRRVVRIKLDPNMERPELREFEGDPVATVLADRGAYVAAALTVCRAYAAAGRPDPKPRLASFEGWSDTVGSALTWLGKAYPVDSVEMVQNEDPKKAALNTLLTAWGAAFGIGYEYRVTLNEVIERANQIRTTTPVVIFQNPDLRAAVCAITKNKQPDVDSLGYWMRNNKERFVNEIRFEKKDDKHTGTKWYVQRSNGTTSPPVF